MTSFEITSDFADHVARGDPGCDWGTPQGTPLHTPFRAKVRSSRFVTRPDGSPSYGNFMVLESLEGPHAGLEFGFAHLSERGFKANTILEPGTRFASTGGKKGSPGAGNSTGPHLHGNVRRNGKLIDPTLLTPMFFEEDEVPQFTEQEAATLRTLQKALSPDHAKQLKNLVDALVKRGETAGKIAQRLANIEHRLNILEGRKR